MNYLRRISQMRWIVPLMLSGDSVPFAVTEGGEEQRITRSRNSGVALLLVVAAAASQFAYADKIETRRVDLYETGLAVLPGGAGEGLWIDDNQLITASPQPDIEEIAGGNPYHTDPRVMLINSATRKISGLVNHAAIRDFDFETRTAFVGPYDPNVPKHEIKISRDGIATVLRTLKPGEPLPSTPDLPKHTLFRHLELKSDGYFIADVSHDGTLHITEYQPTLWRRGGRPDMTVPIDFNELGPDIHYFPFLGKYLLNDSDSRSSSATNGVGNRKWSHSYQLTPYRLMDRSGKLEEISYPEVLRRLDIRFSQLVMTKLGMVITVWTPSFGIFLLKDDHIYRLTGGSTYFGFETEPLNTYGVDELTVSPDGCKVSYLHHLGANSSRIADLRYIAIIDLCKENK